MHLLYVTSFNKRLYNHTGRNMMASFVRQNPNGHMLVTYEGLERPIVKKIQSNPQFKTYNLDNDEWLKQWTFNNRDIIPPEYGGICTIHDKNIQQVWGTNFNIQAARWFRKIVSLKRAMTMCENVSHIIFVDCDSKFKQHMPVKVVEDALMKGSVFYHLGPHRKEMGTGVESGFIGFKMDDAGKRFLQLVFDTFDSGNFRKYVRWDDSYIFRMMIEEHPEIASVDVVKNKNMPKLGGHVVQYGPFSPYVQHNKGYHQKNNLLEVEVKRNLP